MLVGLLTLAQPATAAGGPPNILFLLSDDHSAPYLGAYGNPDVRTPNLDRFAAEGLRCDAMFVSCPQCVPSRAALMTGRSPVSVRMVRFTSPLPSDVRALPDLLREGAGYFTGVGGRTYHLDGPAARGRLAPTVTTEVLDRHKLRTFKERVDYVEKAPAQGWSRYGDHLGAFLDAAPAGKPWFFWLGFSDPHHPWDTQGSRGAIDPAKLTLPPDLPDLPGVRDDLARHLAEIEHLDNDVQSVLDVLNARGLAGDTLVVFMGDNGMAFPHGKGALHDRGIHVPLLVRWPGVVKPGETSRALISGEDFAPTMLEAAGLAPPKSMSGLSFLPLLRNQAFAARRHVFAERGPHVADGSMSPGISAASFDLARCVRSDRYKLIYNCTPHQPVGPIDSQRDAGWKAMVAANQAGQLAPQFVRAYFTAPRPTFELYDLNADPGELDNLAGRAEVAEVERTLKAALAEKMILDWDFLPLPTR
ncbi:sulfatase [Singulisphaera sp. GP187]|uniref:sulfatase family protein n=1 Tax=Singulisphaera sp. GP187 TaxID=1882752 RepID=UPI0020B15944|nr:sulfatase [Singulisphaera sp. GP187]